MLLDVWRDCPRCKGSRVRIEGETPHTAFENLLMGGTGIVTLVVSFILIIAVIHPLGDVMPVMIALVLSFIIAFMMSRFVRGLFDEKGYILFCKDCELRFENFPN